MSVLPYFETFAAVVEKGSFTAAAEVLGVSKSVVSKQISHLERHLGVQLLQRTTRRLHLTQAGEVFSSYTQRIMSEVREAEQSVLPLQSEPQGRLRISAPESLAMSLLPEVLLDFQQRFPLLELEIHITGRFIDLVEEGIDVALRVGELEDSSLVARLLMPCGFHACASPEYLKKHGSPAHPDELSKHNCLIYSQGPQSGGWFFKDKKGKGIHTKVEGNLRSDTGNLLMSAALNGNGIFIAPTYMVASALKEGRLETILDDYAPTTTGLYAVYPYSKLVSTKVRAFVDYLVEAWGD
ncbi:MAG: LysR family transcriptional regulator [Candidatus Thiodiazotropha lotti]|uniref:LysR family transcriptional regulator n=1 Tax=Candidatus Thiodiazotropha endoloripes TaxID=1818881 RepID=UPI00083D9763|nr:LysR family transcriptional regulator [Candidatus Thiodiazotropha endoloripes]MCG7900476.1 LysR family transcriptional regulator [Candidatus Thiodiazotropha weberae]MCG7992224.1 LysR family transcriptional regulator [Candidatus Thiodiazotropha lotti]MCG8001502.1 LysR family transcriptional regulator [Candidatus Thiodiazotropha lotti]MCW4183882.1 LysR family transcriptional regulator [Candidatus Thiodiazotropha weberae]MCW4193276.1 LysR family transcriptional regulator [Candidatus Thiodiazot